MAMIPDPNCPIPEFIAAADLAINRLVDIYCGPTNRTSGMCFFGENFQKDGLPYEYARVSAFGKEENIVNALAECFKMNPHALKLMTKAWFTTYLNSTKDKERDPHIREERRILLRLLGKNPDGSIMTPTDEARAMADQILREHPERELAIKLMMQQAKKYRQSGLNDMRIVMEQCAADLKLQIAQDEHRISLTETDAESIRANIAIDAEYRRQQLTEARRVKECRLADLLDEQEIQHDYEQHIRRAKLRREFIERMTAEAERYEAEALAIEKQHPQFNVHKAAQRKRQQIASRQRERNAGKKKGKEADSCST